MWVMDIEFLLPRKNRVITIIRMRAVKIGGLARHMMRCVSIWMPRNIRVLNWLRASKWGKSVLAFVAMRAHSNNVLIYGICGTPWKGSSG